LNTIPKISVIVPVYNAAAHLEQCVRSILGQTYNAFEVIAINDGSIDNSGILLDTIAVNDKRLHVYHTTNNGVSAARNLGLIKAVGEYVSFADADDWMEPCLLQKMLEAITAENYDWAICNATNWAGANAKKRLEIDDSVVDAASDRFSFLQKLMCFWYDNANWNKLYRASIIRQQHLRFDENMNIWEDLLFNLQYAHFVQYAVVIGTPLYNYRILPSSLNHSGRNRLQQLNKLYKGYQCWSAERGNEKEWEVFRIEIARMLYYHQLEQLEYQVVREYSGFMTRLHRYKEKLLEIDPGFFYFPQAKDSIVQRLKKNLLVKKKFTAFALLVMLRSCVRKTN
jgi:glycosyltransferase involved in cell wall biosynthesis